MRIELKSKQTAQCPSIHSMEQGNAIVKLDNSEAMTTKWFKSESIVSIKLTPLPVAASSQIAVAMEAASTITLSIMEGMVACSWKMSGKRWSNANGNSQLTCIHPKRRAVSSTVKKLNIADNKFLPSAQSVSKWFVCSLEQLAVVVCQTNLE